MDDDHPELDFTISSRASSGKSEQIRGLSDRLLRESFNRQETDELYQRLQTEYDILLTKHAEAENTIDQLRIMARVDLFSDGPIPHQTLPLKVVEVQSNPRPIYLKTRGDKARVDDPKQSTTFGTQNGNDFTDGRDISSSPESQELSNADVIIRVKDLQNDIIAFQSALADRELSFEQQKHLFNALKDKHKGLKEQIDGMKPGDLRSQGVGTAGRAPENYLDPNSLEGELYRLELRLAEVCEDIGEQLFSGRGQDGPLERALRDDFQRMRLESHTSDLARPNSTPGLMTSRSGDPALSSSPNSNTKKSRVNSYVSDHSQNESSSTKHRGSSSRNDKKDVLSPSNEDLAESGYYASESMLRESPKRETVNVPLRYLTRSRSPDAKTFIESSMRRHWSLSEMGSHTTESIDEVIVHSSDERDVIAPRLESGKYRSDQKHRVARDPEEDKIENYQTADANSVGNSSRQSRRTGRSSRENKPVATSSPLDERDGRQMGKTVHDKGNQSLNDSTDEIGSQRRRRRSRSDGSRSQIRMSPSERTIFENRSEGRKSSIKSGSRISKPKSRLHNYSSSEESYPTNRPDKINSSVYSEQDKVPSLINHPKGNIYGARNRPNTADSNLDSGFVGSEGTLRSQELSSGGKYVGPGETMHIEEGRTMQLSRVPSRERLKELDDRQNQSNQLKQREGSVRSAVSQNNRRSTPVIKDRRDSIHSTRQLGAYSFENSNQGHKPSSTRLREKVRGHDRSDDVISFQTFPESHTEASYRRLPVNVEKSLFRNETRLEENVKDSHVSATGKIKPENIKANREQSDSKKNPRSSRSSFASYTEPRTSLYRLEDGTYNRLPERKNIHREGRRSLQSDKPQQQQRHLSADQRSLYGSTERSQHADRLHSDLQLLRKQLAQLNCSRTQPDRSSHSPLRKKQHELYTDSQAHEPYDDLKQQLDELRNQLKDSINKPKQTSTPHKYDGNQIRNESNQDYEELKTKIDLLAYEVKKSRDSFTQPETSKHSQVEISPQGHNSTFIPVCPICSGVGYHKHGNYVFPRDFLESGQPVHLIPSQEKHDIPPTYITSTPAQQTAPLRLATPIPAHTAPLQTSVGQLDGHVINPTAYRSMPNLAPTAFSPKYGLHNTIHHIHTFQNRRTLSSSSDSLSDDEIVRHKTRKQNKSRNRRLSRKTGNVLLGEYDDWRLNESLNEATKAASNMQRISRRMLTGMATDLIKSGCSEF